MTDGLPIDVCGTHQLYGVARRAHAVASARVIAAPPELPLTTILKVRPGHVVRMHARPGGKLLFRVLPHDGLRPPADPLGHPAPRGVGGGADLPRAQRPARLGARRAPHLRRAAHALAPERRPQRAHGDRAARRRARAPLRVAIGAPVDADAARHLRRHRQARTGAPFGSSFGCCILALSGHQPKILTGSDRRAPGHPRHRPARPRRRPRRRRAACAPRDRDVRWLMRTVPVGTQVTIRR